MEAGTISTRPKSPSRIEAMTIANKTGPIYSTKVLLGNWVEDRIECPKRGTLYFPPKEDINYEKLKPDSRQPDFRLNKLYSLQGSVATMILHDSHAACGNFASTNDLVYNHLPKPLCGPDQRYYRRCKHQYYPQPDLTKCFGNVTEWGLRKFKQHEWACTDISDYTGSLYDDTYVPPYPHQYLQLKDRKARNSLFSEATVIHKNYRVRFYGAIRTESSINNIKILLNKEQHAFCKNEKLNEDKTTFLTSTFKP